MKSIVYKIICFCSALIILTSCAATKPSANIVVTDPVCAMNVNKSESYVYICSGKKYYFDSYECKETFKVNPQTFIEKKCVPNNNIIDPVCGLKMDLSESYDLKYNGKVYHFHSNECKQAFKINPTHFIMNSCTQKDSIK